MNVRVLKKRLRK